MSAPDPATIDAVADLIWDVTQGSVPVHLVEAAARALHAAGWLRTAEDRAVLNAAARWRAGDPDVSNAVLWRVIEQNAHDAVARARRVAAGGTAPTDPPSELCMSRGPRIGNEGCPYCKLPKGHAERAHRPAPSDGWEAGMSWIDPRPTDPKEAKP